jgi:hypothetical protein
MEDRSEKIIVYQSYDTVMDANLAKTKLDAYGIPCFLTDENFVAMYPIRNNVFPGVRLFIFENDLERTNEVMHVSMSIQSEVLKCPNCQSENIQVSHVKQQGGLRQIIGLLMGSLFANMLPGDKHYLCRECAEKWT